MSHDGLAARRGQPRRREPFACTERGEPANGHVCARSYVQHVTYRFVGSWSCVHVVSSRCCSASYAAPGAQATLVPRPMPLAPSFPQRQVRRRRTMGAIPTRSCEVTVARALVASQHYPLRCARHSGSGIVPMPARGLRHRGITRRSRAITAAPGRAPGHRAVRHNKTRG